MCGASLLEPYVSLFPEHPGTHPKLPPPLPLRNARNTSCYPSHRCLSLLERWVSHLPRRVEQEGSDLVEGGWKCGFGVHRARSGIIWTSPQYIAETRRSRLAYIVGTFWGREATHRMPPLCVYLREGSTGTVCRKYWMEFPPHKAYYCMRQLKWHRREGCIRRVSAYNAS